MGNNSSNQSVVAQATETKKVRKNQGRARKTDIGQMLSADNPPAFHIERMPEFIKFITQATPAMYKHAVADGVFAPLGCYMHGVHINHIDKAPHEATIMCVMMAPSNAGKSCWDTPIKMIMEDIEANDAESRQKLKEWNKACNRKGANEKKEDRPEGLRIQSLGVDITHAALIQRLADSAPYRLYYKGNEIEVLKQLQSSRGGNNWVVVICYNFDWENSYGTERVGKESVCEKVWVRLNMNLSTTIDYGRQFLHPVLTKGPVARFNVITIPDQPIGVEAPQYGIFPASFREDLKVYIDRLKNCKGGDGGLIDCPEARAFINKLNEETSEYAALTQDRVLWEYTFRALVIAHIKAVMLYVLNDYQWSEEIEEFIRYSYHADIYCKNKFFLDDVRQQVADATKPKHNGPRNCLTTIEGKRVTGKQIAEALRKNDPNISDQNIAHAIRQYVSRRLLKRISTDKSYKTNPEVKKGELDVFEKTRNLK